MIASHARWQLVTTFNEWGEGTAVEGAKQWRRPAATASTSTSCTACSHPAKSSRRSLRRRSRSRSRSRWQAEDRRPVPRSRQGNHGSGPGRRHTDGPPRPGRSWAHARYHWLVCSWTGDGCVPAGNGRHVSRPRRRPRACDPAARHTEAGSGIASLRAHLGRSPGSRSADGRRGRRYRLRPDKHEFQWRRRHVAQLQGVSCQRPRPTPRPTAVLTLGDTAYECGDTTAYAESFAPSWGRMKPIIHPAIGNHEYGNACHRNDPSPYFKYFGAAAGTKGWYSYDVGSWHFIVLNSECHYGGSSSSPNQVGGCDAPSPQAAWLRHDLAIHHAKCTLAYWHEPRFSSGEHGDALQMGVPLERACGRARRHRALGPQPRLRALRLRSGRPRRARRSRTSTRAASGSSSSVRAAAMSTPSQLLRCRASSSGTTRTSGCCRSRFSRRDTAGSSTRSSRAACLTRDPAPAIERPPRRPHSSRARFCRHLSKERAFTEGGGGVSRLQSGRPVDAGSRGSARLDPPRPGASSSCGQPPSGSASQIGSTARLPLSVRSDRERQSPPRIIAAPRRSCWRVGPACPARRA